MSEQMGVWVAAAILIILAIVIWVRNRDPLDDTPWVSDEDEW